MSRSLLIFACIVCFEGFFVSSQIIEPVSLTRIIGSSAEFRAFVTNVNNTPAVYRWVVNSSDIIELTVENSTFVTVGSSTSNKYNVTASIESLNLTTTLMYANITIPVGEISISLQTNQTQTDIGTSTLIVRDSCPPPPGLSATCRNYMCSATNVFSGGNSTDSLIYECQTTSTCSANAEWSSNQTSCNTTSPIGCRQSGRWGQNCSIPCGTGCMEPNSCDFSNGSCTCQEGFMPPLCNDSVTCSPGKWGLSCNNNCSQGCLDTTCAVTTGACTNSTTGDQLNQCQPGYSGANCSASVTCPPGKWGLSCNNNCSQGCLDTTCAKTTGVCTSSSTGVALTQCKIGYVGGPCTERGCQFGVWGEECTQTCGDGCPTFGICDFATGNCITGNQTCLEGYDPPQCSVPRCDRGCNGGTCVAPNLCQLCPVHFSSGSTCRNIRLDGFLRGSLSTFAILTAVVVLLSVSSRWYVRRKVKQNTD